MGLFLQDLQNRAFDFLVGTSIGKYGARLWHQYGPSISIPRKIYGLKVYFDLRDNIAYVLSSTVRLETGEPMFNMLSSFEGMVWDVGSNVGMFSLRAASLGHKVISFDISKKALELLELGARKNKLKVVVVEGAFSTKTFSYEAITSASTENRVKIKEGGINKSITYLEAAKLFGIPRLIKMDIEGGELEFLESEEFKDWIITNKIIWVVEIHDALYQEKLWTECCLRKLDSTHFLLSAIPH